MTTILTRAEKLQELVNGLGLLNFFWHRTFECCSFDTVQVDAVLIKKAVTCNAKKDCLILMQI